MTEQQVPKLVASLVEHQNAFVALPTEDAQWVIQNTVAAIGLFITALKNRGGQVAEEVMQVVKRVLTPFMTIPTGATTKDGLVSDIEVMPSEVASYAKSMMENEAFTISKEEGRADLVSLSIAELGLTEKPRTDEFMTAEFCEGWSAKHLDGQVIELCQPEDGPQLRKQWKDQPKGTTVWLAMERITVSGGGPCVWRVGRDSDGKRWLRGDWAGPGARWVQGNHIVFRLRKI